ncbi:MAG: RluA family pseudouridine synthase [Candidatus Niyogibacteria bacterium]|nr:MAG: RluA family pseudouridine synthase [Candidatus Niyogibacteria bacterium]
MEPDIIYEDKNFLAVNKPYGIVVHPDERHRDGTLAQSIVQKYPEIKNVGDRSARSWQERPGIVHRLDKDTSGLLLVAKNQPAFDFLKNSFQKRLIKKTYLVLVMGELKKKDGRIDLPIARSRKSPMRRVAGRGLAGKEREAATEYRVTKSFNDFTLLEARPLTGRTHQIRAHFAAIGHPVVCDKIYGGKKPVCPAGLTRQFLHAWRLEFVSPTGAKLMLEADLPEDLDGVLRFLDTQINKTLRP